MSTKNIFEIEYLKCNEGENASNVLSKPLKILYKNAMQMLSNIFIYIWNGLH